MSDPSEHAPNGTVVKAIAPDGTETVITDWVGAVYDLVIQSADFGSGFLSMEDAVPLARLAELLGYPPDNEATRYLEQARREEVERAEKLAAHAAHGAAECAAGRHAWWKYAGIGAKCMREGCDAVRANWRGEAFCHDRTT